MIEAQKYKFAPLLAPISVAGGATATSLVVDTNGFSYADIIVFFGLIGGNGVATLKIQESDNDNGSSASDITGANFSATLPVDADDGKAFSAKIPLGAGRKRYLVISLINGATNATVASAFALLHRAAVTPDTAAERGLLRELILS